MFREITEEVKNMNKEQETLQKEQADLKENQANLPEMNNIITEISKLLERLSSKLTSDEEKKCHLKSEEIQNIVETEEEGRRKMQDIEDRMGKYHIRLPAGPGKENREACSKNFPDLMRDMSQHENRG